MRNVPMGWGFDRLFDEFLGGAAARRNLALEGASFAPSADVHETALGFELSFDLPGIPKDDIKIELNDGVLTISGERKADRKERDDEGRWITERSFGRFERSFRFPVEVDGEKVKAACKDGVLTLTIPKSEKSRPRQITVQ